MVDISIVSLMLSSIIGALTAGMFGALKYYSNTIGNDPEKFEMEKFAPLAILGAAVSVGFALGGVTLDSVGVAEYITANTFLAVLANTIYTIAKKKWFPSGLFSTTG